MSAPLYLCEVSWEVCNKVGGIHTVITSKMRHSLDEFGERYLAIGPWQTQSAPQNFREEALSDEFRSIQEDLADSGIVLHYGRWLIEGEPAALLVDWSGFHKNWDRYKKEYWEKFQLDTLATDFYDFDTPILWSTAVGLFIQSYARRHPERQITAHVHEWMSGGVIFVLPQGTLPNVKTVFTTHATCLGRALTSRNIFNTASYNPESALRESRQIGITAKHQSECIAARQADVFTAVSSLTGVEAERLWGTAPAAIVENGMDVENFPTFAELCQQHEISRDALDRFTMAYFFPAYRFDLTQTFYHFTMGRYEFHNKGYDLFLDALADLNREMQQRRTEKTVVALFLVPGDTLRLRPDLLTQLNVMRQVDEVLRDQAERHRLAVLRSMWEDPSGSNTLCTLLPPSVHARLDALFSHLPHLEQPPLTPYELRNPDQDPILRRAQEKGLLNREEDRVKVIFLPVYFDGFDGVFNLSLYDLITGCDLGVFPSAYEPWGYTPMESLVLGVPAVTSTLSGFGNSAQQREQDAQYPGIFLLPRSLEQDDAGETRTLLTRFLDTPLEESRREWVLRRMRAYESMLHYSWRTFYPQYSQLYHHSA
jgi:glycogen(starch) synthase